MFHIYPLIHKNGKNSIKKTLLNAVVDHHVAVEIEEEQKVGQPQNSEDQLDNMDPNIVLKARENCAD